MKVNLGIAGASGRIGKILCELIEQSSDLSLSCGLVSDTSSHSNKNFSTTCQNSDIWIDFSTPDAFETVLAHCIETETPLVTGTTGLTKKHFKDIEKAAEYIPILWASNFSISINLIQQMLTRYTKLVDTDVEITETHHIHKKDMPSGTAITLARSIKPHGIVKKTDNNNYMLEDIAIHCERQDEVPGIHKIELDNDSEQITIEHSAKNPKIFAQGALNVARWLIKQSNGQYTMSEYIDSLD